MNNRKRGFTLLELMIAIMIFAIISIISYRVISALLITKETITKAQDKLGGLAHAVGRMSTAMEMAIPLVVRGADGNILPALVGKNKLEQQFDAQLELTMNGRIGDPVYGTDPPKRVGFRFVNGTLYEVSWPVLNRVITTVPRVDILLNNIKSLAIVYWYPDKQWRDIWPLDAYNVSNLPTGVKITVKLTSGEEIIRQWNL